MQKAKDITEIIKNLAQVIAILIAGIWTYYLFGQKEAPGLEPRADAVSSLLWQLTEDENFCRAVFNVKFVNNGNSSYDISKVHIRGWHFGSIKDSVSDLSYFDIAEIQKTGEKIFDKVYENTESKIKGNVLLPFINHYSPGSSYNHSFEWEVKNIQNKWICFKIDFYKDKEDKPEWTAASWDLICNAKEDEDKP